VISILTFPIFAAALVYLAGRQDKAHDPRLTALLLTLSAVFPLLLVTLPKVALLPATSSDLTKDAFPWAECLLAIWALGFLRGIVCIGRAALNLQRWHGEAVKVDQVDGVAVCELANLSSPVAAGIFHPVVFVPTSWRLLPECHRQMVLEHELAHHRRGDPLWRLLATLASAIHWFNPLVPWMTHRFFLQCEFACDTQVLNRGFDPKVYSHALCDFASERSPNSMALAMAESSSLESRVHHMLQPVSTISHRALTVLGLCGVLAACSLGMIGRKDHSIPAQEIQLRLSVSPFPSES
jgi:beta-lactamase regulating signal transducer with metallopeptidase domain